MDHCEDDFICHSSGNEFFDQVIGHIEDIVLSEDFLKLHASFLEKYWSNFEFSEENKLEYMEIFNEYTKTFDAFFLAELNNRIENFDMDKFAQELNLYQSNTLDFVDSEIFELLHSFSNYQIFKDLMLDYRRKKEGHVEHLDFDILITKPLDQYNSLQNTAGEECQATNIN